MAKKKAVEAIIPLEREVIRASVPLTDNEILKKSRQMADRMRQKRELEEALKTYQTQEKAKINSMQADITVLEAEINSGSEIRDIECEISKDTIAKERIWRSIQSGECLKREPFRKDDYQLDLADQESAQALFPKEIPE